ncbi:hypothetical protein PIB30_011297 [Stylosanthes scabra]|uniref:Uncharacterized protein n=1 Tax=Stylosanthes scabra TaxID=79078 RepID=A0ABU6V907_9FABA|nr:hypothetical protein [Stylosanthes scabra]
MSTSHPLSSSYLLSPHSPHPPNPNVFSLSPKPQPQPHPSCIITVTTSVSYLNEPPTPPPFPPSSTLSPKLRVRSPPLQPPPFSSLAAAIHYLLSLVLSCSLGPLPQQLSPQPLPPTAGAGAWKNIT